MKSQIKKNPILGLSIFTIIWETLLTLSKPGRLLQLRNIRDRVTQKRLKKAIRQNKIYFHDKALDSCDNAVTYNYKALIKCPFNQRISSLIYPILSVESVRKNINNLKWLFIGCRSESELFMAISLGVPAENVHAIDLISYSNFVDIGDMHSMPYENDQYDIIIAGWVWSYSTNWSKLKNEILRVAKRNAYIGLSADYSSDSTVGTEFNKTATHVCSTKTFMDIFEINYKNVYFKHDSNYPNSSENIIVFRV